MIYYRFNYTSASIQEEEETRKQSEERKAVICRGSRKFNQKLQGKAAFHISCMQSEFITLIAAVDTVMQKEMEVLLSEFATSLGFKGKIIDAREITIKQYIGMLRNADINSFIEDKDEEIKTIGLEWFDELDRMKLDEELISRVYSKKEANAECQKKHYGSLVISEMERIFSPEAPKKFLAHPAHYLIVSDDEDTRSSVRELLLGALYHKGRLKNRRVCIQPSRMKEDLWFPKQIMQFDFSVLNKIYSLQDGGTVLLKIKVEIEDNGECADTLNRDIINLANTITKYRRNVLTVIEIEQRNTKLKNVLMKELSGLNIIKLEDEVLLTNNANIYLENKAKTDGIRRYSSLLSILPKNNSTYSLKDLNSIYDKWFDDYLYSEVYKQYASTTPKLKESDSSPKGDAFTELTAMIGLSEAKAIIKQMIDYNKAQRFFIQNEIKQEHNTMHMIFTGNPGTAKTTVARLIAQIMKDNDLLSVGRLVEVSRADLVGRYVGWTAQIVKAKFQEAKGSVLFLDEAYSLIDNKNGMFGDEAINTIVQEMENNRNDTVVVFAGYSDKMEEFLLKNPGLRSRIAFHIFFPDYSVGELLAILDLLAKKQNMKISDNAQLKIRRIIEKAIKTPDFGNGRYVRNLLEKAKMKQASRLLSMGKTNIDKETVCELIADDFNWHESKTEQVISEIGFRP